MYTVLLFDDRLQARISLKEKLEELGMEVIACRSVYEAKDTWNDRKKELNAIVLDVMLPSSGLEEDIRPQTEGGVLTGWVWLWQTLISEENCPRITEDLLVVVYSAYMDDFEEYITSDRSSEKEKAFSKRVPMIPKGNESQNIVIEHLENHMRKIIKT